MESRTEYIWNLRRRRFLGFGGFGSGATLAYPVPVGGVVAGGTVGAVREDEAGTLEGGIMELSRLLVAAWVDGVTVGAGLGMAVSDSFLSSA